MESQLVDGLKLPLKKEEVPIISYDEALDNFYGNWVWRAIHALLDHQDFDRTPMWISRKLGIPAEETVEALEGLKVLSLCAQDEEGYKARQIQFLIPEDKNSRAANIKKHKNVSQQLLNRYNDKVPGIYRLYFAASNHEEVKRLGLKVAELFDEFDKRSQSCEKEGVYGITLTGVDLFGKTSEGLES